MALDYSKFERRNVLDTCSVWNLVSSKTLFVTSFQVGCGFGIASIVHYECLLKPRRSISEQETELKNLLTKAIGDQKITLLSVTLEDLEEIGRLQNIKRLGKGELASIALARRIRMAFTTDDQKARKLATSAYSDLIVQTIPHLFGWLLFERHLSDGDKKEVIAQHSSLGRPLQPHFDNAYLEALQCRCFANVIPSKPQAS